MFKLLILHQENDQDFETPYRLKVLIEQIPVLLHSLILKKEYENTMSYLKEQLASEDIIDPEEVYGNAIAKNIVKKIGLIVRGFSKVLEKM